MSSNRKIYRIQESMTNKLLQSILLRTVLLSSAILSSCQKERLVEKWPNQEKQETNGRNSHSEQTDSTKVTSEFDINGWEGSIDADFTFGSEETE